MTYWNGVAVTPSEQVYEKPQDVLDAQQSQENDDLVVKSESKMESAEEVAA